MRHGLINKLLLVSSLLLLTLCAIPALASVTTSKDSSTYYEVDFTYPNVIDGKVYKEEADLLRDKQWLNNNKLRKVGDTMILSIPEFGVVNARATVVRLVRTKFNPIVKMGDGSNMVTGKFIHYSNDVRAYKLKDLKTGYTQTIKATPNHAFYVTNRIVFNKYLGKYSHFIEIQYITPKDTLINESGDEVKLVCNPINNKRNQVNNTQNKNNNPGKITYRHKPCGNPIDTNNQNPIPVYNLEIYSKHQYLVTDNKNNFKPKEVVLVHNMYNGSSSSNSDEEVNQAQGSSLNKTVVKPNRGIKNPISFPNTIEDILDEININDEQLTDIRDANPGVKLKTLPEYNRLITRNSHLKKELQKLQGTSKIQAPSNESVALNRLQASFRRMINKYDTFKSRNTVPSFDEIRDVANRYNLDILTLKPSKVRDIFDYEAGVSIRTPIVDIVTGQVSIPSIPAIVDEDIINAVARGELGTLPQYINPELETLLQDQSFAP